MKRLISVLVGAVLTAALVFGGMTLFPGASQTAAAAANSVSIDAMLGKPLSAATQVFGGVARKDESEYGFNWSVCNKNYKKFAMVGMDGDGIAGLYTNMPGATIKGTAMIGSTRASVRALLGEPIAYIQSKNTTYIIPNTEVKDVFVVGDYYYTVFYDKYLSYTVDAFLLVSKDNEETLIGKAIKLDDGMTLAYARQSFDLINSARAIKGMSILQWLGAAGNLATARSTDMRDRDYFDHYTPDGKSPADLAKAAGLGYKSLGENIACGHRNAIMAHEAFMNSSGHRSNILSTKYTHAGTGVAAGGKRFAILTCTYIRPSVIKTPVSSISLNKTDLTVTRTKSIRLTPKVGPTAASNKKVRWTSSNTRVASVSSSGVVTGKGKGTATITCISADGSKVSVSCTVKVNPLFPSSLKLAKRSLVVTRGKTVTLKATLLPRNTDYMTLSWTSSNPAIASVDGKGRVKGLAPGTATITATTVNGIETACTIIVR